MAQVHTKTKQNWTLDHEQNWQRNDETECVWSSQYWLWGLKRRHLSPGPIWRLPNWSPWLYSCPFFTQQAERSLKNKNENLQGLPVMLRIKSNDLTGTNKPLQNLDLSKSPDSCPPLPPPHSSYPWIYLPTCQLFCLASSWLRSSLYSLFLVIQAYSDTTYPETLGVSPYLKQHFQL